MEELCEENDKTKRKKNCNSFSNVCASQAFKVQFIIYIWYYVYVWLYIMLCCVYNVRYYSIMSYV